MCETHSTHLTHHADDPMVVTPKGAVRMNRRDFVRAVAVGSVVTVAACETNPETGRQQFTMGVSDSDLVQMAQGAWLQTLQETPRSRDARANQRLSAVGQRISQSANRPNDQWEFVVFDSDDKNAFVLPGGKVGFYKGLMDMTENDDQIASVMGHEVGHVTGRHAAERMGWSTAAQLGMVVGAVAIGSQDNISQDQADMIMAGLGLGIQVGVLLPFSRNHELEADRLGVDYMHRAGYDVRQSIRVWELMSAGSRGTPEFLSTHPSPETRIQELRRHINARGYALV
jgi:predicted Zn-dependent protease